MLGASAILPLFQVVRDAFNTVLTWVRAFFYSIYSSSGGLYELRYLFVIGIAVAVILVSFKLIRYIIWGG